MSEIKPIPYAQRSAIEQEEWDSRYEEVMARVREIANPGGRNPPRSPEEVMESVRAIAEGGGPRRWKSEEELWRIIAQIARGGPATLE